MPKGATDLGATRGGSLAGTLERIARLGEGYDLRGTPPTDGSLSAEGLIHGGGAGVDTVVHTVRALRERGHDQPILAMGYLKAIVARGRERTLRELREAGIDALIVPDVPAGEDRRLERLVADAGLGICFLVTPNSSPARLEAAVRGSTAFLYVVPLYGVTGARERVAETTVPLLERIRATVDGRLPVAVGFGISSPEHVRELAPAADGIIVGSAVVAALDEGGARRVGTLVAGLAAATHRAA